MPPPFEMATRSTGCFPFCSPSDQHRFDAMPPDETTPLHSRAPPASHHRRDIVTTGIKIGVVRTLSTDDVALQHIHL